ncbi:hypothetical protein HYH02_006772 [Chlamydomonas schloesseri]|uniref:Protein kinase domain-containing protein n=1 Tax=Chlamydomonas schloesseri TaxID=2026947 RepID=A0A835WIV6_9CHLO|nr:hypothetical protein HYH02_006772 [Chlamydomonas schloesseri]|eukprot:KAG2448187.1 hypothetical protein HYH02_006772 [Chlamydomonas schloesseri]
MPISVFESEAGDGQASCTLTTDSSLPVTTTSSLEECTSSLHSSGAAAAAVNSSAIASSALLASANAPHSAKAPRFSLSRLVDMRSQVANLSLLGVHGPAIVLRGQWQLAEVAVKLVVTPGGHTAGSNRNSSAARPEVQLLEGPLSKCLRAPNACAAEDAAAAGQCGLEREFTRDSGWGGLRTDSFAQVFEAVRSGQGLRCDSVDGFGDLLLVPGVGGGGEAVGSPTSYSEALLAVEAAPGSYVTQLIMEYCDQGSLSDRVVAGAFRGAGEDRRPLFALLRTLHDVAAGMSYLHTNGIIHGQLTPANVLLRSSRADARGYLAKVSGFGLSACVAAAADASSPSAADAAETCAYPYMAPELFDGVMLRASDVWSFAATAYHCWTGVVPYGRGLHPLQLVAGVCDGSLRLQRPTGMPEPLWRMLAACLNPAWQGRPNFKQIRRALRGMEQTLCGV